MITDAKIFEHFIIIIKKNNFLGVQIPIPWKAFSLLLEQPEKSQNVIDVYRAVYR